MPKLERLITLARLKQHGTDLTVRELSQECGVSERTLYRYLNSLSELAPLADLDPVCKPDANQLSADDTGLLRHLLENHPLARYPHFARRIDQLIRVMGIKSGRSIERSIYDFRPVGRSCPGRVINNLIDRFSKACVEGRSVRLLLRGRGRRSQLMWPRAIRVRGERVLFMLARTECGQPAEFELDQILQMSLSPRERLASWTTPTGFRQPRRKKG